MTQLPCVGPDAWKWDLDHANHRLIVGPCLSCSEAVTGCLRCPLLASCAKKPSQDMIRGGVAHIGDPKRVNGYRKAQTCQVCANPIVDRPSKKYCSKSCEKDTIWTYSMARFQAEQSRRFANLVSNP